MGTNISLSETLFKISRVISRIFAFIITGKVKCVISQDIANEPLKWIIAFGICLGVILQRWPYYVLD